MNESQKWYCDECKAIRPQEVIDGEWDNLRRDIARFYKRTHRCLTCEWTNLTVQLDYGTLIHLLSFRRQALELPSQCRELASQIEERLSALEELLQEAESAMHRNNELMLEESELPTR